ncbi:hypothetical protein G6F42_016910 [Rhizopus arrhizus]|nr:hypothetical protein G6F42_016910 [Rhizopus arrhizus]
MFYDECKSQFLSRTKTKHLPSSVFGKHCAITDYSFMSANSTLHLLRTVKDKSPDTAVYYNVHDLSLRDCHITSSVYSYYNVSGGLSTKRDPRPVDLIWRLAIEEMETKKYTNQEGADLLFSAVLLAFCRYIIPNNAIVRYSGALSFLYNLIKYHGDYVRATTAVTVQISHPMML